MTLHDMPTRPRGVGTAAAAAAAGPGVPAPAAAPGAWMSAPGPYPTPGTLPSETVGSGATAALPAYMRAGLAAVGSVPATAPLPTPVPATVPGALGLMSMQGAAGSQAPAAQHMHRGPHAGFQRPKQQQQVQQLEALREQPLIIQPRQKLEVERQLQHAENLHRRYYSQVPSGIIVPGSTGPVPGDAAAAAGSIAFNMDALAAWVEQHARHPAPAPAPDSAALLQRLLPALLRVVPGATFLAPQVVQAAVGRLPAHALGHVAGVLVSAWQQQQQGPSPAFFEAVSMLVGLIQHSCMARS